MTKRYFWRYFVTEIYFSTNMQKCIQKKLFSVQTAYLFTRKRGKLLSETISDSAGKVNFRNNKHIKIWFGLLSSSLLRGLLGVCVRVCVGLCVLTTCWMTRQPSDRSSDRVTARWQPPRASSGKPFETGSHPSTDTKTPAGMAVDGASSKSSGWKLNQRCEMANCASKYLANITVLRPEGPSCKLSSDSEIQLC